MPASPQVAKGQMLELLLHNISDNYKFCSAIFNAKIVITAHWYSFPYLFFFFLHIPDNSGCSRGISMGEHPNGKKHWNPSEAAKKSQERTTNKTFYDIFILYLTPVFK